MVSGRQRLVYPKDAPSAFQAPRFLDKRHKRDTRWRRDSDSATPPDEVRLRKARKTLADFGTLWRDPEILDRMRE